MESQETNSKDLWKIQNDVDLFVFCRILYTKWQTPEVKVQKGLDRQCGRNFMESQTEIFENISQVTLNVRKYNASEIW